VHGRCAALPDMKAIMDVADHENVAICWNSNAQDLKGAGLEHNFNLVRETFGATCHVRTLDDDKYPYPQLFDLLVKSDYEGWVLLEAGGAPDDRMASLKHQRQLFQKLVIAAQQNL